MATELYLSHTVYRTVEFSDEEEIDPENDDKYQNIGTLSSKNPSLLALQKCAQRSIDQLDQLQIPNAAATDLYLYSLDQQTLQNKNLETLNLSQVQYAQEKTAVSLTNEQFAAKLQAASISSGPIHVQSPLERINQDPSWAYKLDKMHQNMAVAQMGSAVVSTIETVFHDWFSEIKANVERQGRGMTDKNPLLRRRCRQIAELGQVVGSYIAAKSKELVNITCIPELVEKAYAFYNKGKNNHSLADQLEQQFDIPRELGIQYERNAAHILPSLIPFGTIAKMGKMGVSSAVSFAKVADGSLSAIAASIRNTLKTGPEKCFDHMLCGIYEDVVKLFPNFDSVAGSSTQAWSKALSLKSEPTLHYYGGNVGAFNNVVKLTHADGAASIIKDSLGGHETIAEFMGLHFLETLNLTHFTLPKVQAMGTRANNVFLIKSYLPGAHLSELFTSLNEKELLVASRSLGKAVGELHNKGAEHLVKPSEFHVSTATSDLIEFLEEAREYLSPAHKRALGNEKKFGPVIEGFLRDPGLATFALRDVSGSQFVWDAAKSKWGYIDAEMILQGVTTAGRPRLIAAQDFAAFMQMFEREGLLAGVSHEHITKFKAAFSQGYAEEYHAVRSAAADQFFDVYASIETIDSLAQHALDEGSKITEQTIRKLLEELNRKLVKKS